MEFLWPAALWGLALVAGLAAGSVWAARRPGRRAWIHPWAGESLGLARYHPQAARQAWERTLEWLRRDLDS